MQFPPSFILRPFVKNYSVVTTDREITNEVFYPSGYIDFVVNISGGEAATIINGETRKTPAVELLGHLTVPTRLNAARGTRVLIARLFPFACPLFFPAPAADFTNYATNLDEVLAHDIRSFYEQTMSRPALIDQVQILDDFLIQRMRKNEDKCRQTLMTAALCRALCETGGKYDALDLSQKFGVSERSVQKLFREHVGLSPAGLFSVKRFNKALDLILTTDSSLTSIAYDCGYYDQAHFIKEFRKFTGVKPTEAKRSLAKNGEEFQRAVNIGF